MIKTQIHISKASVNEIKVEFKDFLRIILLDLASGFRGREKIHHRRVPEDRRYGLEAARQTYSLAHHFNILPL